MDKSNFKYGLKLDGRFAGHFEVFTRKEVESLSSMFERVSESLAEGECYESARTFEKLSWVFRLRDLEQDE